LKILIIPEDPTLDQHIIKPIVERICTDQGTSARIDVLRDPHLRGVAQALDQNMIAEIIRDNPMEDLFLLMIDRDCDRFGNSAKVSARVAENKGRLIGCLAQHEVEVWMLALHRGELGTPWRQVREECDPKEAIADPFIASRGWSALVGRGRKRAMRSLGASWPGILKVCPELGELHSRIGAWAKSRGDAGDP